MYSKLTATTRVLLAVPAIASIAVAGASPQPVKTARRPGAAHRQVKPEPLHFGDFTVSGFETGSVELTKSATVTGPGTVVDIADPKQPTAKNRIEASQIVVYFIPNTNRAERVEATGSVRFSGSRPAPAGSGVQTYHGTGTRAVYNKSEDRMVIQGPVTFAGEQPTEGGKQTVAGTAATATYDQAKEHLALSGGVDVTMTSPQLEPPGAHVQGDQIDVDLSRHPYQFVIHNGQPRDGSVHFRPKPGNKK